MDLTSYYYLNDLLVCYTVLFLSLSRMLLIMILVYNWMELFCHPFLNNGFIIEYFNRSGKIPVEMVLLQMWVIG